MKRRIHAWESLTDYALRPHHSLDLYGGELTLDEPLPVLRNEALWQKLMEAQTHLEAVEAEVLAACTREPLDDIELEVGQKLWLMVHDRANTKWDREEWDQLEDLLKKHLETA